MLLKKHLVKIMIKLSEYKSEIVKIKTKKNWNYFGSKAIQMVMLDLQNDECNF